MNHTIFCDVDGTLLIEGGEPNRKLIEWLRVQKANGYVLNLWSMRGREYAQSIAQKLAIEDLFESIVSKPRHIVDDAGWGWIRFTHRVPFEEIESGDNLEIKK